MTPQITKSDITMGKEPELNFVQLSLQARSLDPLKMEQYFDGKDGKILYREVQNRNGRHITSYDGSAKRFLFIQHLTLEV